MRICRRKLLRASGVIALVLGIGCDRSPQSREAAYLKRGLNLAAHKDYARAALEFRSAAQAMPTDAEPRYRLGLAYLNSGRMGDAFSALKKAVELNPHHGPAQLKLAELMLSSQNHDLVQQAANQLQALLESSPDNTDIADRLAISEWSLGKPEHAELLLQQSLEKFPSNLTSSVALSRIRLSRNDLKGAVEVLKNAIRESPRSAAAAVALGELYLLTRSPNLAETELRRALQLDPRNAAALLSMAAIQRSSGRMSEAEETLRKLAALPDPAYKPLHARFLFETGQRDAALAEFETLAKAAPDDRQARSNLISAYLRMNRIQAADDLLARSLKKNPKDTDALLQRSVRYLQSGKVEEAGADLKQVIRFTPGSAPAHFALASVYKIEGRARSEREELTEALRLNPSLLPARLWLIQSLLTGEENEAALSVIGQAPAPQKQTLALVIERNWALLFLGRAKEVRPALDQELHYGPFPELVLQDAVLKMKEGNYASARAAAGEVLKKDPENARAAHIVVDTYAAQKQNDKASEWLAGVVAARPKSAPLQYLLGQWDQSLGKNAEARKAFESVIASNPTFPNAGLSLAELDLKENQIGAARRRLLDLVNADRKNVKALLLLATVEDAAGSPAAAISYYREVLGLDGNNVYALNNLANHLTIENPDEALKLAQQVVEVAPDNPAVQDTLGWIYYRKGMYGTAVEHLKVAASKAASPRRQFHLGMAYLKSGEHDLGRKMVALALQSDPSLVREQSR